MGYVLLICLMPLNGKSYILTKGTSVKDNSDMNDFKTPGNYSKNITSGVKTLKNCPFDDAFTLKIEYPTGVDVYLSQTYRLYNTGEIAYRYYDSNTDSWSSYVYFSDDATLFAPQDVAITDGDYGHVNGNFKRIGSLLVFSFWITLTKEYIGTSHDPLFTFDSIKSSGRYDIPIFQSYSFGKPVAA